MYNEGEKRRSKVTEPGRRRLFFLSVVAHEGQKGVDPRAESVQRFWPISVQMPRSISFGPRRIDLIYLLDYWLFLRGIWTGFWKHLGKHRDIFLAQLIVRL